MNKPHLHNNIISTSSFQNGLSDLLSSTDFYFESKVIKDSHNKKIMFFFILGQYAFQWQYAFIRFMFLMKYFFQLTVRMSMITKLSGW